MSDTEKFQDDGNSAKTVNPKEPSQDALNKDMAENPSTEKQVPDDQANQGGG